MWLGFVALCALFCVCGCSPGEPIVCDESKYGKPSFSEWRRISFVTIVDDSLAILKIDRSKSTCGENYNTFADNYGLFLVNYRVKQKPLFGNILDNDFPSSLSKFGKGYYTDSSVVVFDGYNNFGFCKIGVDSIKLNKLSYYKDKMMYYDIYNVRPWKDGNVLFGQDDWYILDTKTGQIELFERYKEYKWLTEYDKAVFYIENKVVSIRKNMQTNNFELIVNGNIADTLNSLCPPDSWPYMYGRNYIAINMDNGMQKILKIDTIDFKFDTTFAPLWIGGSKFYKNDSDFVQYFAEDLLEVND